jgi:pimeloyl-ACP methyl ester carboxylesterase
METSTRSLTQFLAIAAALTAPTVAACGDSSSSPKSYVLVHGAWSNHDAWDGVVHQLRAAAATADAIDLPAHGDDTTPVAGLALASYVDKVEAAIDQAPRPVILVGHSMAGIVVSQVAEDRASDLHSVVYVGAYVPQNGENLFALSMEDAASKLGPALRPDGATLGVDQSMFADLFCADCDATARASLVAGYREEPIAPLQESVTLTDAFAGVAKTYIHTTNDQVISPAFQHQMTQATPMTTEVDLGTSHMAMLAEPDALADLLLDE